MKFKLPLIILLGLSACNSNQDIKNIVIKGQIFDQETNKPISNAEVVGLCWYFINFEETTFKKQIITADTNGRYELNFEKGHQIDIASKAQSYFPQRSFNTISNSDLKIDLRLAKIESNATLVTLSNSDKFLEAPFLRVRINANKKGEKLDFDNMQTFGFDCKTMTITSDTLHADFWFMIEKKETQPTTIVANIGGGIVPIIDKQVKSSLLYEMNTAPSSGYQTTYRLKGNEEGFFILCRDGKTYGKIILEKSNIDISQPDGKGSFYREFGKKFTCFYQPNTSTNLAYPNTDIDLESFLVDSRMR